MDGEYSKLEKDFLGNERMVHYDASGTAVSASKVDRSEDGTMMVGEPIPLNTPAAQPISPPITRTPKSSSYPPGTVATIGIASFVVAALAALFILNSGKPESASERFNTAVYREPVQLQPPTENLERVPGPQEIDSPQPRQEDEPPLNGPPPGDQDRPRIDLREEGLSAPEPAPDQTKPGPKSEPKTEPPKTSDPIDLRGDGDESR